MGATLVKHRSGATLILLLGPIPTSLSCDGNEQSGTSLHALPGLVGTWSTQLLVPDDPETTRVESSVVIELEITEETWLPDFNLSALDGTCFSSVGTHLDARNRTTTTEVIVFGDRGDTTLDPNIDFVHITFTMLDSAGGGYITSDAYPSRAPVFLEGPVVVPPGGGEPELHLLVSLNSVGPFVPIEMDAVFKRE